MTPTNESKWREFWILMGEQDDIVFTKPSHMKNAEKYIHVTEISALDELRTQLAAAKEENARLKTETELLKLDAYDYAETKSTNDLFRRNIIKVDEENKALTEKLRLAKEALQKIMRDGLSDGEQKLPPNNQSMVAYEALAKLEGDK